MLKESIMISYQSSLSTSLGFNNPCPKTKIAIPILKDCFITDVNTIIILDLKGYIFENNRTSKVEIIYKIRQIVNEYLSTTMGTLEIDFINQILDKYQNLLKVEYLKTFRLSQWQYYIRFNAINLYQISHHINATYPVGMDVNKNYFLLI